MLMHLLFSCNPYSILNDLQKLFLKVTHDLCSLNYLYFLFMQQYTFQTLLERSIAFIIVMNIVYIRCYLSGLYGSVLYHLLLHINAGLGFLLLFNKLFETCIKSGASLIPVFIMHSFSLYFQFLVNQNHEVYAILWSSLYSKTKNTEVSEFTG